MNIKLNQIAIVIASLGLGACGTMNTDGQSNYYAPYSFGQSQHTATAPLYPDGYDNTSGDAYTPGSSPGAYTPGSRETVVTVPESYHVGSEQSPTSFKVREKSWANRQNPQNYTIQLDESEKASEVAKTLQKAPKDARRAEIKYDKGGEKHYRGVYGTYGSYEAAQKAMQSLPDDLKQNASVKSWGSVQNTTGQ